MLHPVPGGPQPIHPDPGRRQAEPGQHRGDRPVADRVEPALHAQVRAVDQVRGDLLGGQVPVAAAVPVGVRRPQVRGVRTQRAVGEQVPGRPDRAQLASLRGGAQLAPVPVHLRQVRLGEREQRGEVGLVGDLRAGALVHRGDAQRRRPAQGHPLGGAPLGRRDRVQRHPPYRMVRVGAQPAGRIPARLVRRYPTEQRGGHHRRVTVHPGQIHRAATGGLGQLLGVRRLAHRPAGLVPAVPDHHPVGRVLLGVPGQPLQHLAGRPGVGQVQAEQRHPGTGRVHVRVHERRRDQATGEVHDRVRGRGVRVGAQPGDRALAHQQRGGLRVGRTVDAAVAVQRGGHDAQCAVRRASTSARTAGSARTRSRA